MDSRNRSAAPSILGFLALVISVVALIFAWVAFSNTSDENLEAKIQDQMQDTIRVEEPLPQQPQVNDGTLEDTTPQDTTLDSGAGTEGTMDGTTDTQDSDAVMPENN